MYLHTFQCQGEICQVNDPRGVCVYHRRRGSDELTFEAKLVSIEGVLKNQWRLLLLPRSFLFDNGSSTWSGHF